MNFRSLGIAALAVVSAYGAYRFTPLHERFQSASCAQACEQRLMSATDIEMRSIPLSWGNNHNLYVNGEMVGRVEERTISIGTQFDIYAGDKKIGHAQEQVLAWGDHSTVYDADGKQLGTLDQKLLSMRRVINVHGNTGMLTATERIFTPTIASDLTQNDAPYGSIEKSYLWDQYHISLPGKSPIDNRLLIALVAMEEKLDEERKEKKDEEERKSQEERDKRK